MLVEVQSRSLDAICSKFPALREKALIARSNFRRVFGPSVVVADAYLLDRTSSLATSWSSRKQELVERGVDSLDFSQITEEDARTYIETVRTRTKGEMPEGVYQALAFFNPRYAELPHLELVDGYRKKFESKGHAKSLGLNIMLHLPLSWSSLEGDRPHVVQKFESPTGGAAAMLLIKDGPPLEGKEGEEALLQYIVSEKYVNADAPGSQWLASGQTVLAGQPGYYCDILLERETMQGAVAIRTRAFYFVFDGKLITVACDTSCAGSDAAARAAEEFTRYEACLNLIAGGVDVLNKYE